MTSTSPGAVTARPWDAAFSLPPWLAHLNQERLLRLAQVRQRIAHVVISVVGPDRKMPRLILPSEEARRIGREDQELRAALRRAFCRRDSELQEMSARRQGITAEELTDEMSVGELSFVKPHGCKQLATRGALMGPARSTLPVSYCSLSLAVLSQDVRFTYNKRCFSPGCRARFPQRQA